MREEKPWHNRIIDRMHQLGFLMDPEGICEVLALAYIKMFHMGLGNTFNRLV